MDTTKQITRRTAASLLLVGATLPAAKAFATHRRGQDSWASIDASGTVVMATFSGGSVTAAFESELQIGSRGGARGFMSFEFGDEIVDYLAQLGGLDFDEAGVPNRAWFLLLLRGSDGGVVQDYALGSVDLDASEPFKRFGLFAHNVHFEPVRFEVQGQVVIQR